MSPPIPIILKHTPLPKSIPNKELLERLSYTYQANVFLNSLGTGSGSGNGVVKRRGGSGGCRRRNKSFGESERQEEATEAGEEVEEIPEVPEVPEIPESPQSIPQPSFVPDSQPESSRQGAARFSSSIVESGATSINKRSRAREGEGRKSKLDGGDGSRQGKLLSAAARSSIASYKEIAKHNMLKMDPSLKRTMCKACDTILIPGLTARVRVKTSRTHINRITTTCLNCSQIRTIPAPPLLPPSDSTTLPQRPSLPQQTTQPNILVPSTPTDLSPEEEEANNNKNNDLGPLSSFTAPAIPKQTQPPPKLKEKPQLPRSSLDGPIRAARRAKAARPIPFWEREAGIMGEGTGGGNAVGGAGLSIAEQAAKKASKWEKKGGHGQGRGKSMEKQSKAQERQDGRKGGHSVWAGEKTNTGWGIGIESSMS